VAITSTALIRLRLDPGGFQDFQGFM